MLGDAGGLVAAAEACQRELECGWWRRRWWWRWGEAVVARHHRGVGPGDRLRIAGDHDLSVACDRERVPFPARERPKPVYCRAGGPEGGDNRPGWVDPPHRPPAQAGPAGRAPGDDVP